MLDILVTNWQDWENPRAGGAEVHLREVFGRLAARGHRVTLVSSSWPGAPRRLRLDGIDVHRVGGRFTFAVAAPRECARLMRAGRVDVLVENLNKVPLFSPRWSPSPVLLLVHHLFGGTAFRAANPVVAALTWALERPIGRIYRTTPVVSVSESTAHDMVRRGIAADDIGVVHNGIPDDWLHTTAGAARSPEPSLVYVGRLERYKRVDLIVRAVARLVADGVPVNLTIAGEGDARGDLVRLASCLGIDEHVEFAGRVSEQRKRELMETAWVHVLTSSKEGWGLTVMEAAICGTPTVASDAPGLRDAVVHDRTGLLVPHGEVEPLAAALAGLLRDHLRRERFGLAARRRAASFTWDAAADGLEDEVVATAAHRRTARRGAWARLRPPSTADRFPLPRNGTAELPFGCSWFVVHVASRRGRHTVHATLGATDRDGHHVALLLREAPVSRHAAPASPFGGQAGAPRLLDGWPTNPEAFLGDVVAAALHTSATVRVERGPAWSEWMTRHERADLTG